MMVLTFVLPQCFIVKLLTKPILLRISKTFFTEVFQITSRFILANKKFRVRYTLNMIADLLWAGKKVGFSWRV